MRIGYNGADMEEQELNLLGGYGAWAAEVAGRTGRLSFAR